MAFQCHPDLIALGSSSHRFCVNQYRAQIFVKAVDITTDFIIALLPSFAVYNLEMSASKRWIVAIMFGSRIMQVTLPFRMFLR